MTTPLAEAISKTIQDWETGPDKDSFNARTEAIQSTHAAFIQEHGQETFDLQVVQEGGMIGSMTMGASFYVLQRNQVRLLKAAGLIQ